LWAWPLMFWPWTVDTAARVINRSTKFEDPTPTRKFIRSWVVSSDLCVGHILPHILKFLTLFIYTLTGLWGYDDDQGPSARDNFDHWLVFVYSVYAADTLWSCDIDLWLFDLGQWSRGQPLHQLWRSYACPALYHVTTHGGNFSHIFEICDPYLSIHYTIFIWLRWRLRTVYNTEFHHWLVFGRKMVSSKPVSKRRLLLWKSVGI